MEDEARIPIHHPQSEEFREALDFALDQFDHLVGKIPSSALAEVRDELISIAEIFRSGLDIRAQRQQAQAELMNLIRLARRAHAAVGQAHRESEIARRALDGMNSFLWTNLFSGRGMIVPTAEDTDGIPRYNQEELLSDGDFEQFAKWFDAIISGLELAQAEQKAFLERITPKKSRPLDTATIGLVRMCAEIVAKYGADNTIAKSINGPFHGFVEAVAALAGVESVSYQHLRPGIGLYRDSRKLENGASDAD